MVRIEENNINIDSKLNLKYITNTYWMRMDCGICGKEYKSWEGKFCHKRKVHNCVNVHSRRYDYETKNATRKCMHCHKHHRKPAMEKYYLKSNKENFTWIKCKLCQKEQREETLKDHIRRHNRYIRDQNYMKAENLEELLNIERYDDAMIDVGEHRDKQTEFNRRHFELGRLGTSYFC